MIAVLCKAGIALGHLTLHTTASPLAARQSEYTR